MDDERMDPVARFGAIVSRPEGEIELDEAALAMASGADPELDAAVWLIELDRIAEGVADLDGLRRRLFIEHRFRGNVDAYDEVDNSLLHRVIERGVGIPISLSVLTIEVGRRAGIPLHGVGMPGHFLVGIPGTETYLDAFHGGRILDLAGAEAIFRTATGAGEDVPFGPEMLPVVGPHAILSRMLNNLKAVYATRRDARGMEWVTRMKLELPDASATDINELATAFVMQGRFIEGASELEERASERPAHASAYLAAALAIRSHLN